MTPKYKLFTRSVDAYLQGGRDAVSLLALVFQGKCFLWNRLVVAERDFQEACAKAQEPGRLTPENASSDKTPRVSRWEQELMYMMGAMEVADEGSATGDEPEEASISEVVATRLTKLRLQRERERMHLSPEGQRAMELARIGRDIQIRQAVESVDLWPAHSEEVIARFNSATLDSRKTLNYVRFDGTGRVAIDFDGAGQDISSVIRGECSQVRIFGGNDVKITEVRALIGIMANKSAKSELILRPALYPGVSLPTGKLHRLTIERLWDGDQFINRLHFTMNAQFGRHPVINSSLPASQPGGFEQTSHVA